MSIRINALHITCKFIQKSITQFVWGSIDFSISFLWRLSFLSCRCQSWRRWYRPQYHYVNIPPDGGISKASREENSNSLSQIIEEIKWRELIFFLWNSMPLIKFSFYLIIFRITIHLTLDDITKTLKWESHVAHVSWSVWLERYQRLIYLSINFSGTLICP